MSQLNLRKMQLTSSEFALAMLRAKESQSQLPIAIIQKSTRHLENQEHLMSTIGIRNGLNCDGLHQSMTEVVQLLDILLRSVRRTDSRNGSGLVKHHRMNTVLPTWMRVRNMNSESVRLTLLALENLAIHQRVLLLAQENVSNHKTS